MTAPDKHCDRLYYDGTCPLCRREIAVLEKAKGAQLKLVDLHKADSLPPGLSLPDMLKSLHLIKPNGDVVKGLEANIIAWEHTRLRLLVGILRWPVISTVAHWVYNRWATRRYEQRYHQRSANQ